MKQRRRLVVGLGLVALIGSGAAVARAYILSGQKWPGASPVVPFYVSTTWQGVVFGGDFQDTINAIVAASDEWRVGDPANPPPIPISSFRFDYQGTTTVSTVANDGINAIIWKDEECPYLFGCGGYTTYWYLTPGDTIIGFDVVLYSKVNGGYTSAYTVGNTWGILYDLQTTMAHEFGHAIGFTHSNYFCAVMGTGCIGPGITKHALTWDDIAGMQTLYGYAVPKPVTYCTPKHNSCGKTPAIFYSGFPGVSRALAGEGFSIKGPEAKANKLGLLMYSPNGKAAQPFHGGTLCVNPVGVKRGPPVVSSNVGTSSQCKAEFSVDWNAFALGNLGGNPGSFLMQPGQTVNVQWWGRDTFANGSYLTDALEYTVAP